MGSEIRGRAVRTRPCRLAVAWQITLRCRYGVEEKTADSTNQILDVIKQLQMYAASTTHHKFTRSRLPCQPADVFCMSSSNEEVLRMINFLRAEAGRRKSAKDQANMTLVQQVMCDV